MDSNPTAAQLQEIRQEMMRATSASQSAAAAALAAGLIAASGRPHSPNEARKVYHRFYAMLFGDKANSRTAMMLGDPEELDQPHK